MFCFQILSWTKCKLDKCVCIYMYIHTNIRIIPTSLYIVSHFLMHLLWYATYIFLKRNLQAILDLRKFSSILQCTVNIMGSEWQNCSIYPTHGYIEFFQCTWRFFFQVPLCIYCLCTYVYRCKEDSIMLLNLKSVVPNETILLYAKYEFVKRI